MAVFFLGRGARVAIVSEGFVSWTRGEAGSFNY
ncbi:MAG: hypothetical protein ACI87A_001591 [Planctomycetota bacterium]